MCDPLLPPEVAMRGVPYVLLHELVAHAFQRLGAEERATSARDPVAEGWMDFVARFVFVRAHHHLSGRRREAARSGGIAADIRPNRRHRGVCRGKVQPMSTIVSVRAASRVSIVRAWLACSGGSRVAEVAQLAGVEKGVVSRPEVAGGSETAAGSD